MVTSKELRDDSIELSIKGNMHADARLYLNALDESGDIYRAFQKYAKSAGMSIKYAAEPCIRFADGDDAAYEGNLTFGFDLSKYRGKGYKVLIYQNGKVEEVSLNDQMIASFETSELVPFAVLINKSVKTGDIGYKGK